MKPVVLSVTSTKHMCLLQMKHKESTEAGGGVFAPTKPIKEGLVSQIASKFQNNETVVLRKKSSTSEISPVIKELPKTSVVASVSRTESHQARFNSARAMFEKMGSADDLDSISSSNGNGNRGSRASSVQRSRSTSPFNTKVNPVQPPRSPETPDTVSLKTGSKERVFTFFCQYLQNRMTRSSSTSAGFSNGSSASTTASNSTNLQASTDNGHSSHIEAAAASEPPNTGLVKARTMSYQQKVIENGNNEASEATEGPRKTSVGNGAGPRPNIKELTNKQRNWFSSFERSKNNEPIDSARRTSVKNDSTPSLLSGGSSASEARPQSTPTGSPKSSLSDATPTPPSNLDRPRDRRPLSARCSSDSIEDYIRNWKNGSDESSTSPTNQEKNRQNSPLQTKDVNESAKIVNEGKAK